MSKWLVVWVKGARMGSVPLTEENLAEFKAHFVMRLIQRDASGTEHWEAIAKHKRAKKEK